MLPLMPLIIPIIATPNLLLLARFLIPMVPTLIMRIIRRMVARFMPSQCIPQPTILTGNGLADMPRVELDVFDGVTEVHLGAALRNKEDWVRYSERCWCGLLLRGRDG